MLYNRNMDHELLVEHQEWDFRVVTYFSDRRFKKKALKKIQVLTYHRNYFNLHQIDERL